MNISTEANLARITLKSPVITASGTFGAGKEYNEFVGLSRLGAVVTRDVTAVPRAGNPTPCLAETPDGILNAISLQNPGVDVLLERDLSFLRRFDTRIVAGVCGHSEKEYVEVVERLRKAPVSLLELNISCPNVKGGGIAFSTQTKAVEHIARRVKERAAQPLIVKLSPNIMDITETARVVEADGAGVLSLINTLASTRISIIRRSFVLTNRTGGLLGPTVHPITMHIVHNCTHAVKLPLIGTGGVLTAADAIEMIPVGTTAVSVDTANFYNPCVSEEAAAGIAACPEQTGTKDIRELVGTAR